MSRKRENICFKSNKILLLEIKINISNLWYFIHAKSEKKVMGYGLLKVIGIQKWFDCFNWSIYNY